MKFSWNSLKVSLAGARLSHLVQKDKIWDHGSMTEQVKAIFYHVEKAMNRRDATIVEKYLTGNATEQLNEKLAAGNYEAFFRKSVITEVAIIHVQQARNDKPDCFRALVKGKRQLPKDVLHTDREDHRIENFSDEWLFVRQGEWWLLDRMKHIKKS